MNNFFLKNLQKVIIFKRRDKHAIGNNFFSEQAIIIKESSRKDKETVIACSKEHRGSGWIPKKEQKSFQKPKIHPQALIINWFANQQFSMNCQKILLGIAIEKLIRE